MASIDQVVQLIFKGVDQASGTINGIAKPLAGIANAMLVAETAALALGAAIGVKAVQESVKFQDSLYLVQKQLGENGPSIEQARQDIEGLALQYGINANDVAQSVADFLAAGYDYETSAKLVATSTQLMIAGQLEAQFATDAIKKSLAGFRVPANEAAAGAEKVGDVLNKIGDISSGKFEEIVQGFQRISPTAKDAGLSMEETASAIAVLVDVFGSGEIAATALKSGLLSLLDPSKEAKETLDKLGVTTTDNNGQLKQSKEILQDLAGKWGTLTDAQKQQTAAIIFGKDQAGAMSALLGDWGKQQKYVAQLVDETTGAVGSMAREVEGKSKLMSQSIAATNEAWRQLLENLGRKLTTGDDLNGLVKSVGDIGIALKSVVNGGGLDPLVDLVKRQAAKITETFTAIAENLPAAFEKVDWSGLITSLEGLQGEIGGVLDAFFGAIDLTTVDGLASAIQTVINTFKILTQITTGIVAEFKPFAAAIGETVQEFNNLDDASKADFGSFLGQMKAIADAGILVVATLIAIGRTGADVGDVLGRAFDGLSVPLYAFKSILASIEVGFIELEIAAAKFGLGAAKLDLSTSFSDEGQAKAQATIDAQIDRIKRLEIQLDSAKTAAQDTSDTLGAKMANAIDGTSKKMEKVKQSLIVFKQTVKDTSGNIVLLAKDIRNVEDATDSTRKSILANNSQMMDWSNGIQYAKAATIAWGKEIKGLPPLKPPEGVTKAIGEFQAGGKAAGVYATAVDGVSTVYRQVGSETVKASGAFAAVADKTADASNALDELTKSGKLSTDQLIEVTKTANDFEVKMGEIASNERIMNIQAAASIKTSQLETDADRVKSTFASIDSTVQSTGDLLGSLFGNLADADRWTQLNIEKQIAIENQRRQEALDIQKKLAEAEIERVQAQIAALNRGDALIKIEGGSLAPELEAFMWKILSLIRARANAEFSEYLLGVGAA